VTEASRAGATLSPIGGKTCHENGRASSPKGHQMTAVTAPPPGPTPEQQTTPWHTVTLDDLFVLQGVDEHQGLTTDEADARRAEQGPNRMAEAVQEPRWRAFLRQYADPMQVVLLVAGIGSLWPVKQYGTGLVILFLTLVNAVIGLRQEGKAAAAVAALQKMMIVKAKALRDGAVVQLPAEDLVPGDVVALEAGDVVPADGRLIHAATLEVAEAALTGESLPVSKGVAPVDSAETPLGDRTDMVYMNTSVTRGAGEFVVTATGQSTEVGHISRMLQAEGDIKTPLTRQLDRLTNQILLIGGVALAASMAINLARGDEFTVVFTAAVAFAISAIPTGLPAVVTTILSMGTQQLAKAGAIMKRLRSTETLGSTSAINSDKTGTLTLNQMTAVELALVGRHFSVTGTGYATEGHITRTAGVDDVPLEPFLLPMALASDAVVKDGELVGDPTEGALVVLAEKGGVDVAATRTQHPRVAELPFDADYKLMATFHRMNDERGAEVVRCFVKGAPDQLLARASMAVGADGGLLPVDDDGRSRYLAENQRMGEQGLRVLATGRKDFDPATFDAGSDLLGLLEGLTLLALVGIVDPARPQAKAAIATAKAAGIQVRMITGDHAVTAKAIADQLGIEGRAVTGAEFAALPDAELLEAIDGIGVIARVTPQDKVRLVDILTRRGHIVAMTGDGVNDAPALKKADIGIAMGITGTEVSKEAAVMILTDDNFSTIVKAVELGRGLYENLKKYIRFQMGVLLGFIVAFLGASILDVADGVPFVPLQTLFLNFTTDLFLAVGLGYGAAATGLMQRRPRAADEQVLPRPLLVWLAVAGAVMGAVTLAVIGWAEDPHGLVLARTMGLTTFSLSHIVFAVCTKDERRSVFTLDTLADRPLLVSIGLSLAAIVLATTLDPFERLLQTAPLELEHWLVCIGAALAILVVSEVRKALIRRPLDEAVTPERPPTAATAARAVGV
jgi:Ca2+-transporting ATPase